MSVINNKMKKLKNPNFKASLQSVVRGLALFGLDMLLICICSVAALLLRYDFSFSGVEPVFWKSVISYIPWNILVSTIIFWLFKLYTSLWRFASVLEFYNIILASFISSAVMYGGMYLMNKPVPRSYPVIYLFMILLCLTGTRFFYRFLRIWHHERIHNRAEMPVRTMVVGAGEAGNTIIKELLNSKHLNREIPCIIDDDPKKKGTYLHRIPIVGGRDMIPAMAEKYTIQEIIIAIPTLAAEERRKLLDICQETGCKLKALPGIYQMVKDEVKLSMLREVEIEDLLGREPVQTEIASVMAYVEHQVVLVTGGGGSIGSELCRQIALHHPKQLIIFDIYENNAYDLQMELLRKYPKMDLLVLIGSVRDKKRVFDVFEKYHPNLVFHAAAHKHVPLMETSPNEAIKNNVVGTFNVAKAADIYKAKKMILISTDKAVRPTNIMGASKRICEMIIQEFSQKSKTEYAAVRFGNVLGSNGSVIPLFRRQIAEGGPVTVTHPDITRYFMTIPEAASLVLQAGAFAKGGEIFILDMGEPVRILDLAKKMIRLSGYSVGKDIKIVFTGLRPGEKLYEELLLDEKHLIETENEKIFVCQQDTIDILRLKEKMQGLYAAAAEETADMRQLVREIVPEYRDPEDVNGQDVMRQYRTMETE